MKKTSLILAFLAIIFGLIIFTFSLISYSNQEFSEAERLSEKKLYFGEKVLPDHIFYPFLMIVDKSLISMSSGESRVYLRIRMAQDRMISAKKLLNKGEEQLALSTLTKSQKYLILASQDLFLQEDYSDQAAKVLLNSLNENTNNLIKIEADFKTIPTNPIADLIVESKSLLETIENKIR